jgi:cation diffusion facilitator CzcD-associated flavoprotein CzcO
MSKKATATPEEVDVLIVGAGLSGIGAARHLQMDCPQKSFRIVEMRDALGGTWDLFRYPGIRSDSDCFTFSYNFKPWPSDQLIGDGELILDYLKDAASETGVDQHISYGQKVLGADWSTEDERWTVTLEDVKSGEQSQISCGFLYGNTGYYRYDTGYEPDFPGIEDFGGQVVKPQFWPEDLDYEGKKVVIIGSGATAVTILPAMTDKAEKVTMLQRTPTYMLTLPKHDPIASAAYKLLGRKRGFGLVRWANATRMVGFYHFCQTFPGISRRLLTGMVANQVKGADVDMDVDFNPPYDPWDQRLCVVPSGDLFKALKSGRAAVVTDHIDSFTKNGIKLKSGRELEADIVITATGLDLLLAGGIEFSLDGAVQDPTERMVYRGCMLSDVPNFAFTVGYTNSSWTLKSDLVAEYVCRVLNHMDAGGYRTATPHNDDPTVEQEPLLNFPAGYVMRALERFPKAGSKAPWKLRMTYHQDALDFKRGSVDDGRLKFAEAASPKASGRKPVAA